MVAAKTSVILAAIVLGATSTYALPTRFNGDLARRATPEESFLAARQLEGAAAPADSATGVTTAPKPDLIHRIKHAFGHHGGDANKEVPLAARQLEGAAATAGSATDVATPPKPSWFHRVKNALTGHRNDPNKSDQHNQHHHDGHHHHHDGHHHDGHHHDGHHHNGQGQGQHGHEHEHYSTPGAQGQHGLQEPGMSGQQGSGMQGQQGSGMQGQQGSGMQGGSSEYQATSSTGSYKKRSWKRDLADSLGLADEFFLKRAYEDDEFVY